MGISLWGCSSEWLTEGPKDPERSRDVYLVLTPAEPGRTHVLITYRGKVQFWEHKMNEIESPPSVGAEGEPSCDLLGGKPVCTTDTDGWAQRSSPHVIHVSTAAHVCGHTHTCDPLPHPNLFSASLNPRGSTGLA